MASNKPRVRRSGYIGTVVAGVVIISLITAAAAPIFWANRIKSAVYYDTVTEYGAKYGADPLLVFAVITVESRFKPEAVSRAGAVGLMQIMPGTGEILAEEVGYGNYSVDMLNDPEINIRLGTYYVAKLRRKYDSDVLTLAAYNAGEGRIDSYLTTSSTSPGNVLPSDLPWAETERYVRSVLVVYSCLQAIAPFYGIG
jgi:soluble lytic murein transglycosylase